MRSLSRGWTVLLAPALLVLSGCGAKLKFDETINVPATGWSKREFVQPLVDQAEVKVSSPGAPVDVYFVLESNLKEATEAIDKGMVPKNLITKGEKVQNQSFTLSPGKKSFTIFLVGTGKNADVRVIATSK